MNYIKVNILILLIGFFLTFISCREIVSPTTNQDENAKILNNPIESITSNSYAFEISAKNNSSIFVNSIPVLQNLDLSLALNNYDSGTVHIQLINNENIPVYNRIFTFGFSTSTANLDGLLPSQIYLEFDNFSGDFILILNGNP